MVLFFQDAFGMAPVETIFVDTESTLAWLERRGLVVRETLPGAPRW
jgi:hypothetical protein